MLDSMCLCAPPSVTSYLWLIVLSGFLHGQPALPDLEFSTRPDYAVGMLGSPVTLHCAAHISSTERPLPVRWEKANGEPVALSSDPDQGIHQTANGSLFFPQLRERDLGRYVCNAGLGAEHIRAGVHVIEAGLDRVFFSPQSQTVMEGQAVFLQCVSGDSSPPADITWQKDNIVLTKGTQIQGQYGGGNQRKTSGTLHLSNVSMEDEGQYICVTTNPLLNTSQKSKAATLTVQGVQPHLQITHGPVNISVAMETEASMQCAVRGFPTPRVQWFKGSHLLVNSSSLSLQNKGQLLVFKNVSKDDEGFYYCKASTKREMVWSQPAFLLAAGMAWRFVQQPSNQTVRKGEPVSLACRASYSRPPTKVSWYKNKHLLTPRKHFTVRPGGDLMFHSVQDSDSGMYFCTVSSVNLNRSLTSRTARLTILDSPLVRLWPRVVTVPEKTKVVFQCQIWGHPLPSIVWSKQGHSTQTGGKIIVGVRNASLSILSVRRYDEGTYICEAFNMVGRDRKTATLRVAVSPIIVSFRGAVRKIEGSSVVLPCRSVGELPISYTWTRGHSQASIIPTTNRHVDGDGALHISSVEVSDAGAYHCTAQNTAGRQQKTATLIIYAKDESADRDEHRSSSVPSIEADQSSVLPRNDPSIEADQSPVLPSNDPRLVQSPEMTSSKVPLQGESRATVSQINSSSGISQVSTPNTLQLLLSVGQTASGRADLFRGQTALLVPPEQASVNPTQPTVTQIQPPPSTSEPYPPDLSTIAPTPDPESPDVSHTSTSNPLQQNLSSPVHLAKPTRPNDSEPTEWRKKNTSQSTMRTSEDPRIKPPSHWLPVLEKHDIPIVVGVGVSLAFIFITMAFYSMVQKNEPTPAVRALSSTVPRNLGIPSRHAERLATARTYENKAFEGDDLVAVIEQSPNTSDTRARPPAPSPVIVVIEPASEETENALPPAPPPSDNSVIAETYPEPNEQTLIDPFQDERSSSPSQPSIQLQCVDDWGGGGVEYGQYQDQGVPPECPHLSPSPSPPPVRDESLRSTLTLQTAEHPATPVHHSVSISHGNAPLLLSHCVSLGLTTVAVDVHFFQASPGSPVTTATAAAATQINANVAARGPQLSSRLAHIQEHEQSFLTLRHGK
ncbi:hypothetical protein UPYG_G00187060 [Umbra pygmaea]|uniref:Ig-like domain-containing protein n=1 Tax=Umbra pygmaea TaxID=75934 RepID=A0ABD0WTH5_UMBPY